MAGAVCRSLTKRARRAEVSRGEASHLAQTNDYCTVWERLEQMQGRGNAASRTRKAPAGDRRLDGLHTMISIPC